MDQSHLRQLAEAAFPRLMDLPETVRGFVHDPSLASWKEPWWVPCPEDPGSSPAAALSVVSTSTQVPPRWNRTGAEYA